MTTLAPPRIPSRPGVAERIREGLTRMDWVLVAACGAITAFSVFVIGRSTESDIPGDPRYYADRQLLYVGVGVIALLVAMRLDLERVARWAWAILGALLGALAVVYVLGTAVRGSNRWIDIGPFSLQPSEFGKVAIVLVLAALAVDRAGDVGTARFTLFLTGVAAVPMVVVFLQPDLGTSLVYAAILAAILFLAGAPWTHFAAFGTALAVLVMAVLWILPSMGLSILQPYQVERLTAFAGAERDSGDAGYQ
ncbi:MAG: FtsW/RodA/SpoVE family cell cycle protein, partial [Thermoleophilia bacterium]|nr:FtsW/RodA/SpoVE family cell cycle protein [Thermoleophilia bacterium]